MSENFEQNNNPNVVTGEFEGPLDLLCHLIEKNKINIYDIPIVTITDQYIEYLTSMSSYDMETTSSFLVMASTLLQIKSRMLLPSSKKTEDEEFNDPREELVIKLLEYRRCKALAGELKEKHEVYKNTCFKMPEPPVALGINVAVENTSIVVEDFYMACKTIVERNKLRYNDISARLHQILKREKISVKDKMKTIWTVLVKKTKVFFNEIFSAENTSKPDRVVGFLALLELLRIDKIKVRQSHPFDVLLIEMNTSKQIDDVSFSAQVKKEIFEEINYK